MHIWSKVTLLGSNAKIVLLSETLQSDVRLL